MTNTDERRFWEKVDLRQPAGCWEMTGARCPLGYQYFYFNGRIGRAHRYSYRLLVGPIPEGLVLDHLCRNPPCVNPSHLEAVTTGENTRRGYLSQNGQRNREKTHCKRAHPFSDENTVRIRTEYAVQAAL